MHAAAGPRVTVPGTPLALVAALALAAGAPLALAPASARAYEDKLTLGVEAGYGLVVVSDALPQHGVTVGLEASVGLDDIWSLRGHLAYALHPGADTLHVAIVGAEILYLVDVVQLVPYFGLGLDGLGTLYEGQAGLELGAHLTLGVEYLLSRDSLIGFDIRPHFLPLALNADRLEPVYVTVTARVSLMLDL